MQRYKWIFLVVIVLILAGWVAKRNSQPVEAVRIGVILPVTGDAAVYGDSAQKAAELAIADLVKEGVQVEGLYEDSQIKSDLAVSAARKLIDTNKVAALVMFSSGETLPVCPIAKSAGVVLLTSGSAPEISGCGGSTFRNYPSDIYQGKVLADRAKAAGYNKVAFAYVQTPYGEGLKVEFAKNFGGTIQAEGFPVDESDFRTQLTKIKEFQPDAIVLVALGSAGPQFLTQANTLGLTMPILGSESLKENGLVVAIPVAVAERLRVVAAAEYTGPEASHFKQEYMAKYGTAPATYADYVYDNVTLVGRALGQCAKSADRAALEACVSEHLHSVSVVGATGPISFDERGDIKAKAYDLFRIQGTEFVKASN